MGFDLSETKRKARQTIHGLAGVVASYTAPDAETSTELKVRFHNRAAVQVGDMDNSGYADMFAGVDRLVFSQSNLDAPEQADGTTAAAVTLARNGEVEFEQYGLTFVLDTKMPPDGPENVYWLVTRKL
jgi:uncharacterized protein RhaS with RHS repeats